MRIDRQIFFAEYKYVFGDIHTQDTVDIINRMIDRAELEQTPAAHFAYIFATSLHESRHAKYPYDFSPISERGGWHYVTRLYYGNDRIRRALGNKTKEDAWNFRGRGLVQITGRTNYERFGIQDNPDLALDPTMAVEIIFAGMNRGIFTGKKLSHYINSTEVDYYNARRIVNGLDKAELIAGYAERFESIIRKSLV